jgi:cobalamin biosynthesis protein CobD/CbiB
MNGRIAVALAITALALTGCAGPADPTAVPGTGHTGHTGLFTTILATTPASTTSTPSNTAVGHYLHVAHNAFPAEDIATLTADAQTICAALRDDPSIHDAVGTLSGRTQSQATANEVVRAAIAAYCPTTPVR